MVSPRTSREKGSTKPTHCPPKAAATNTTNRMKYLAPRQRGETVFTGLITLPLPSSRVPRGQIQPQNTRPKTRVNPITAKAGSNSGINVRVARVTAAATRGSQRKNRFTA